MQARITLISSDPRNKLSIETIEAAAFIICLDNAAPTTPSERFSQFLFEGSNRWYDKPLQFIICANGISASLCEHSVLDGITIEYIHEFINDAIAERKSGSPTDEGMTTFDTSSPFTMEPLYLSLIPDSTLLNHIQEVRNNLKQTTSAYSFAHLTLKTLSRTSSPPSAFPPNLLSRSPSS